MKKSRKPENGDCVMGKPPQKQDTKMKKEFPHGSHAKLPIKMNTSSFFYLFLSL
jgi:hypothetical protein